MVDRIKQVMDYKQMSPTAFADTIDINRSSLTHIFSGRNQPSLDVAKKILTAFPEISTEWLIMGVGNMLQNVPAQKQVLPDDIPVSVSTVDNMQQTDLFSAMEMAEAFVQVAPKPLTKQKPAAVPAAPIAEPVEEENEPEEVDEAREVAVESVREQESEPEPEPMKPQPTRPRAKIQDSHIPVRESKREKISNSQADKKIAKIIFFYDDKSFDVYTPN
ncbi:MAG: helix-turn-helix domain-containing protein [Bacteroidales bacterium]|nr:helix-turn-helix domain-containing protein [Bacteroidales bacterium]